MGIYVRLTFTVSDPKVNPATLGDNKMSKRTVFTTLTPLPPGVSREVVMETLKSHTEMIDLNPLVIERHPIKPPPNATPEEYHCIWYSLTDRVQYLPGGLAPLHGLWLREDVDMRCNIMMGGFVKKTLKKAHSSLVGRLLVKSQIQEAAAKNSALNDRILSGSFAGSQASTEYAPSDYDSQSVVEGWKSQDTTPSSPPMLPLQNISSYRSDQPDSQTGSNPDSVVGGQHSSDRVSWQNLNSRQSPPAGQLEPAYQPANPYRESPSQRYNELPAQQRQDGRQPSRIDGQDQGQAQRYRPHGIAELE